MIKHGKLLNGIGAEVLYNHADYSLVNSRVLKEFANYKEVNLFFRGIFLQSVNSEIYVDKTGVIKYTNRVINTMQEYICVCRPRRFGKAVVYLL